MIQFLHSGLQGAPTNTVAAGTITGILDACLVDGFNALSPVTVTVSAGVATLVYAAPHGYTTDQYLRVLGASAPQVNGDKRPTILDAQSLTVPAAGAPDGPVGGSISTRFAPLGWERVFTDVNVRVYRSLSLESARHFFRVTDADSSSVSPLNAYRGFETMNDASTGLNEYPSFVQVGGGGFGIYKSPSGAQPWVLVGDERTVYISISTTGGMITAVCMGDFESHVPADAYASIITAVVSSTVGNLGSVTSFGHRVARDMDGLGQSPSVVSRSPFGAPSGNNGTWPSPASGGVTIARPVHLIEGDSLRGSLRGIMHLWEPLPAAPFTVIDSLDGIDGRVLVVQDGSNGRVAYPLDEPW